MLVLLMASQIGLIPANQYTVTLKISHTAPNQGSAFRHGAFRNRSGRVNGATSAFTPGMIHASIAVSALNHTVPIRFSRPPGATLLGSKAKLWKIVSTNEIPSATRIALSGARTRSLTAPNHSGTWRSRLHASEIRLMKLMYTGIRMNGQDRPAEHHDQPQDPGPGLEMAPCSGTAFGWPIGSLGSPVQNIEPHPTCALKSSRLETTST